jgi:hypothetical protein
VADHTYVHLGAYEAIKVQILPWDCSCQLVAVAVWREWNGGRPSVETGVWVHHGGARGTRLR